MTRFGTYCSGPIDLATAPVRPYLIQVHERVANAVRVTFGMMDGQQFREGGIGAAPVEWAQMEGFPMHFVLKGYRGRGAAIVPESFDTEEAAKARAFELLHSQGSGIRVEIWLEGSQKPMRDFIWLEKEYLKHDHVVI